MLGGTKSKQMLKGTKTHSKAKINEKGFELQPKKVKKITKKGS
jgi:hypothetical protein